MHILDFLLIFQIKRVLFLVYSKKVYLIYLKFYEMIIPCS